VARDPDTIAWGRLSVDVRMMRKLFSLHRNKFTAIPLIWIEIYIVLRDDIVMRYRGFFTTVTMSFSLRKLLLRAKVELHTVQRA